MRVIVINRKSTREKEDQQVLSIEGQNKENLKRAAREGHTIVATYNEEGSAKQPGRKIFDEAMSRIERGEADAIVCWRLNRLARNPIDGGRIQWMLQTGLLKTIITSEKIYTPSDNVIQMCVEFGMATQYSIDLGKDVKRGMVQKAKMGWRPGAAPIGYLNDYGGIKGEKVIHRDPERFDVCTQVLGSAADGCLQRQADPGYRTQRVRSYGAGRTARHHAPRCSQHALQHVFFTLLLR